MYACGLAWDTCIHSMKVNVPIACHLHLIAYRPVWSFTSSEAQKRVLKHEGQTPCRVRQERPRMLLQRYIDLHTFNVFSNVCNHAFMTQQQSVVKPQGVGTRKGVGGEEICALLPLLQPSAACQQSTPHKLEFVREQRDKDVFLLHCQTYKKHQTLLACILWAAAAGISSLQMKAIIAVDISDGDHGMEQERIG